MEPEKLHLQDGLIIYVNCYLEQVLDNLMN